MALTPPTTLITPDNTVDPPPNGTGQTLSKDRVIERARGKVIEMRIAGGSADSRRCPCAAPRPLHLGECRAIASARPAGRTQRGRQPLRGLFLDHPEP
jgi:hypothetical protein